MKLFKLLFLGLALFIISCGDDDPLSETIIGTWDATSIETTGCSNPADNVELMTPDANGCIDFRGDILCNAFLVFSAGGTAVETISLDGNSFTDEFTFTTNDDNNTAQLCESTNDCATLTFNGNTMTRNIQDASCTTTLKYTKA